MVKAKAKSEDAESAQDTLSFSVDSSLLFQLGERLVAKPSIALAELVKNAYDADATEVTVTLEHVGTTGGTILIEDNGHGMTFEDVQNSWMRIATTEKRDNPLSRIYKRPLTGAKGVGRFAARRLGARLTLQSTGQREDGVKEITVVDFNWKESFKEGKDLDKIPVSYTRQEAPQDAPTGVSLLISEARDAWTEDEIAKLKRDLLSLQNPFPDLTAKKKGKNAASSRKENDSSQNTGFNFVLKIEGSSELNSLSGGLAQDFLATAFAKVEGRVDEKGIAHYSIEIPITGEKDRLIDKDNKYPGLENARFRIYTFRFTREFFTESAFSVSEAQKTGREQGGVRIYLDEFRVFPYGEEGDDWLQLDQYAAKNLDLAKASTPPERIMEFAGSIPGRPYLLIPKNNQVFGVVAISQVEHKNIEINVTRDRLIETPTVLGLRQFVQNGIYWGTLKYAAYKADQEAKAKKTRQKPVNEIIEDAKAAVLAQTEIPEERRQIIAWNLDRAIEQIIEEQEERISEVSMLRILASAGTTLSLMSHQLQAVNGLVLQTEQDLIRLRQDIPKKLWSRYQDIINQVSEWRDMMESQVSQLGSLLSPESRQRRKNHPLHEIVEKVKRPMSFYMKKYGVTFRNEVPRNLRTPPIYRSELYAILINILSNALKAIHNQAERIVEVEAEKKRNILFLRMKDTGIGIPIERREISFKPFVTDSIPNPVLGIGTGIGLKVVKDILELYDGKAHFIDVKEPWNTCIEIIIPEKGVEDDN